MTTLPAMTAGAESGEAGSSSCSAVGASAAVRQEVAKRGASAAGGPATAANG
jgi:hypothetical protein